MGVVGLVLFLFIEQRYLLFSSLAGSGICFLHLSLAGIPLAFHVGVWGSNSSPVLDQLRNPASLPTGVFAKRPK